VRRAELFSLINDLPTCYEVVSGKFKGKLDSAPRKAGPAGGQKKRPRPAVSVARCPQHVVAGAQQQLQAHYFAPSDGHCYMTGGRLVDEAADTEPAAGL
jgi:hypothetical protein